MRTISYKRTEIHSQKDIKENDLLSFCYDIPYFDACGIFPPFHIINQIFTTGGSDGGMSPGALWEPFEITEEEYTELAEAAMKTLPNEIKGIARYKLHQFEFDPSFDHIQDRWQWMKAVCNKHGKRYSRKLTP